MDDEYLFSTERVIIKINSDINKDHDNLNYLCEFSISEKILKIQFGLTNSAERYKNNYSMQKLLHKAPNLDYYFPSLKSVKDQLIENIKNNYYSIEIFEEINLTFLKFPFKCFENQKHNFDLEIFLYKADSSYSRTVVNDLSQKLNLVISQNEELKTRQDRIFETLKFAQDENKILIEQINILYKDKLKEFNKIFDDISENSDTLFEEIEKNLGNLKNDIVNSGESIKKSTKQVYLPILRTEDKKLLTKWFNKDFELILAYDSSRMGDSSTIFHEKSDGKIQTITLIETESGRRFGGYTKLSWNSTEDYKFNDSTAFIFSLDNQTMLPINDNQPVIYCSSKFGPKFGSHDITISDKFTQNSNSYSLVLNSYGNKEMINDNPNTFLAGEGFFKVKKIEVFQVIFK